MGGSLQKREAKPSATGTGLLGGSGSSGSYSAIDIGGGGSDTKPAVDSKSGESKADGGDEEEQEEHVLPLPGNLTLIGIIGVADR